LDRHAYSVMILVFLTVAPSWLRKFPKKTNFLIEVFPFEPLNSRGFDCFKEPRSLFAVWKVNGAPVSDAMELLEGASEWPVPKEKWQITKILREDFLSRGLLVYRGVHVEIPRRLVKPFLMLMRRKGLELFWRGKVNGA